MQHFCMEAISKKHGRGRKVLQKVILKKYVDVNWILLALNRI